MKYLSYFYVFLILITLSGCSVSLRPESSEPSDLESGYYYGDSAYRYYYGMPAPSGYDYYEYSSNYNPWTMGTYYENYSPPKRSNTSSDVNNNKVSAASEDKRPSVRSNDQTTNNQPKAPMNESLSARRERTVEREKTQTEASSSTSVTQKTRRDAIRNQEPQTPSENHNIQNNTQPETKKDDTTNNTDDEEKEKQKRRRRSVN